MPRLPTQIVLATSNKGKVAELSAMLAPFGTDILPQSHFSVSDAEETGLTFIENAIIKARHAASATGLPAIADDSGLAVDALLGAPGIYSARFAGSNANDQQNIELLLEKMRHVPESQRSAQFHCVLVYMRHAKDPTPLISHGIWHGQIALSASGDGGFGYDPIFIPQGMTLTAASLAKPDKAAISHRGQALAQLMQQLRPEGASQSC